MQICFLLKVEHIPVKPSRHLQGLVSITTSRTVSLRAVIVATSESTEFCIQISAPYLYRCFLCLLELIPSPYIMYSCPVQLQVGSFQFLLKAESAKLEIRRDFICPSLQRAGVCEGQSEHSARELRGNWSDVESSGRPGDKEYWLKHYIKDPEIPLAAISLGNSFAVEETIAPSRSPGWFGTVDSPDHFPTGCFSPKEDRAEIISLEVRKEGRKGRILLRTQFFYPHKGLEAWKAWRPVRGVLLLDSCSYLQDEIPVVLLLGKHWNSGFLSKFGPFDPAFMDKNSCYSSCRGEGDWTWSSLLGTLIQSSLWDTEEWM